MQVRQRQILSWFVNEEDIVKAVSGHKLDEDSVESIPENIPSASQDEERADINIIFIMINISCRFEMLFTPDGWTAIQHVMRERREIGWLCKTCDQALEGASVGCDSCLHVSINTVKCLHVYI